jgi:hypothetical protein
VPLRRLDSVVEELKLKHVDVIKIDVEGAEIQVLKGAMNTIARFKPFLIIEVRDRNVDEFLQIIERLRYFCEELTKGAIDKVFLCHSIG